MELPYARSAHRRRQGLSAGCCRRTMTKGEQNIVLGILSNRGDLSQSLEVRRETDGRCRTQSNVVTVYDHDVDNSNSHATHLNIRCRDVRSHVDAWNIGRQPLPFRQLPPLSATPTERRHQSNFRSSGPNIMTGRPATNHLRQSADELMTFSNADSFKVRKLSISSNKDSYLDQDSTSINNVTNYQHQKTIKVYLPTVDSEH